MLLAALGIPVFIISLGSLQDDGCGLFAIYILKLFSLLGVIFVLTFCSPSLLCFCSRIVFGIWLQLVTLGSVTPFQLASVDGYLYNNPKQCLSNLFRRLPFSLFSFHSLFCAPGAAALDIIVVCETVLPTHAGAWRSFAYITEWCMRG